MDRRMLLIGLTALGGCGLVGGGRLEGLTDPELKTKVEAAMKTYAAQHSISSWSLTDTDAVGLLARAQAPGSRVVITREIKLAENLRRTRRAPLENRWTLGPPDAPIAIVVTKGAGEHAAKGFAQWLASPDAPSIL